MISISALSYRYPNSSKNAISNLSLHIQAGEFVILAGESGSGKTTLLRAVNGLVPHFSGGVVEGQVEVDGVNVIEAGPQKLSQTIGFVHQNPEGQALLDVVEPEIAFALENLAMPPHEMRVRVEEVLDLMSLETLRNREIVTLSGGERQRVAIAAVLALRPQILLLDEPTSQLDPKSAEDVLRSLVRLNEDLGLTIIVAEHRLERVLRYADRLIYMANGQIIVDDAVQYAVATIPQAPPLISLGRKLGWTPLPLTVKEGRRFVSNNQHTSLPPKKQPDSTNGQNLIMSAANVQFSHGREKFLHNIDLEVFEGEVVAIMGRNGSGKSTFLKCVIGLLAYDAGVIQINGESTKGKEIADIAKNVAYLPQNPDDLLFAESVYEELEITLKNHHIKVGSNINKLLTDLGLDGEISSYPRDLSTGQRQRVALGAVTITQPKLFLLDEPTRGLDGESKIKLVQIWRRWLELGAGIIIVTHDVELAAQVADRVIILSQGEIIAEGSTQDVLSTSPLFAPQISRLFPNQGWLTVEDALIHFRGQKG